MLNPESVMLNLFQHLFRAGLFQHLIKSTGFETLKSKTLNWFQGKVQGDRKGLFQKSPKYFLTKV